MVSSHGRNRVARGRPLPGKIWSCRFYIGLFLAQWAGSPGRTSWLRPCVEWISYYPFVELSKRLSNGISSLFLKQDDFSTCALCSTNWYWIVHIRIWLNSQREDRGGATAVAREQKSESGAWVVNVMYQKVSSICRCPVLLWGSSLHSARWRGWCREEGQGRRRYHYSPFGR